MAQAMQSLSIESCFPKNPPVRRLGEGKRGFVKGIQNRMQTIETNPMVKGFLPLAEVALLFPPMIKLDVAPPVRSSDWTPYNGDWDDTPAVRCTALDDF
jgi:hypothetical protein